MKKYLIFIIFAFIIAFSLILGSMFEVFQTSDIFYYGIVADEGYQGSTQNGDAWIGQYNLNTGRSFSLLGYNIESYTSDRYAEFIGCKPNPFSPPLYEDIHVIETDENGCNVWQATRREYYIHCNDCNMHPRYWGACGCDGYSGNEWCNYHKDDYCFSPDNPSHWTEHYPKQTETAGGSKYNYVYGCGYSYYIYDPNGNLIDFSDRAYNNYYILHTPYTFENSDIIITFAEQTNYNNYKCWWIDVNGYVKIPDNAFDIEVSTSKAEFLKGENATITINFINNWKPVIAIATTELEVPTIVGSAKRTDVKYLNLSVGDNIITYEIPTKQVTDKLLITPKLKIIFPSSEISNLNVPDNKCLLPDWSFSNEGHLVPVESCMGVDIGDYFGNTYEVYIREKPLYVNETSNLTLVNSNETSQNFSSNLTNIDSSISESSTTVLDKIVLLLRTLWSWILSKLNCLCEVVR